MKNMKRMICLCSAIFHLTLFSACENNDGCKTGVTRCYDNQVEICDVDQNWEIVFRCYVYDRVCCEIESGEHTCVEECHAN